MSCARKIVILFLCLFCFQSINAEWKKVSIGNFAWLHSVYFVDPQKGWIVGSRGTFLETDNGGETWRVRNDVTKDTIRDVYFTDESHGWILAEKDAFGSFGFSPSYILETNDGGHSWKRVRLENEGKEKLVKIFFSQDGFGHAVGETGTYYVMQEDRTTWKRVSFPARFLLLNGSFFSQNNGLIIGGGGTVFFTDDGGLSWNKASFADRLNTKLNSVFFINRNVGWTVGAGGKILMTLNGGKFWHFQKSNVTQDLFDIAFINTGTGWAIGDNGVILKTTTAGNIWEPVQTSVRHKLEKIFFIERKGWAVGFGGTVLRYDLSAAPERKPGLATPVLQKRNE